MGRLTLAPSSVIYLDAAPVIYSVEKHADYAPLLESLWTASESRTIEIVTSELTLLEVLVLPMKLGASDLIADYENLLTGTEVRLLPVTQNILREAAGLRATANLKTPDAIHAASALAANCTQFITNDGDLRRVSVLTVTILKELL